MNVTGILRQWNYDRRNKVIIGSIFNDRGNDNRPHIHARFNDGDYIHTSTIKDFSEDGRYVTTRNSIYELDPPFVEKDM